MPMVYHGFSWFAIHVCYSFQTFRLAEALSRVRIAGTKGGKGMIQEMGTPRGAGWLISWLTGLSECLILEILNITFKYLLEII